MEMLFNYNLLNEVADSHHYYDIITKNGELFDNSVDNIGWKIRMEKASEYKYYPQPFYNNAGKITHKICGVCGEKKDIKHFHLQNPTKGKQRTYLAEKFSESNDLRVAQISLSAYKTAIGAAKAQVIYKKLTGNPDSIQFFE